MSMRTSAGGRLKILVVISPQLVYQAPGTIYTHAVAMEVRNRWGGAPKHGAGKLEVEAFKIEFGAI